MTTLVEQSQSEFRTTQGYPVVAIAPAALLSQVVPVTFGMAFPRGKLIDAINGVLVNERDDRSTAQCRVTSRWGDGSVRWLLVDAVTPPIQTTNSEWQFIPSDPGDSVSPANRAHFRVDDQVLSVEISAYGESQNVDPDFVIHPELCGESGRAESMTWGEPQEEHSGFIRQSFIVDGNLNSVPDVQVRLHVSVWPDHGFVKVDSRLRNSRRARHAGGLWDLGDPGSFQFCSFTHRIRSGGTSGIESGRYQTKVSVNPDSATRLIDGSTEVRITQFGSGQRHWNSLNHVNAAGTVSVTRRGCELRVGHESEPGNIAQPVLELRSRSRRVAIAVPEFWQQYPSSLACANGDITVGLFPAIDDQTYELQGGEQKSLTTWLSTLCADDSNDRPALDWVADPVRIIQSPEAFRECGVFDWFSGPVEADVDLNDSGREVTLSDCEAQAPIDREGDPARDRLQTFLRTTLSGQRSLAERRRSIDEYGWRNFGDIPADHEQQHFTGSGTIVSHYNNQFDSIYGGILQMAASGNTDWFELFDPLARHVADIDIYHTDQDRAAYRGGLFWHTDHYVDAATASHRTYSRANGVPGSNGGGPCSEHNYTTGLLHHYYLTGDQNSKEAVCSLADWVMDMEDGFATIWGLLDDGPTGLATSTASVSYHGPGRASGNSINALLDAWLLTGDTRYQQLLEEIILRCVHPEQDLDALGLLQAETHWSYTIFLTALGRYLRTKLDRGETDAMYSYAWYTLQHYGRWMVRKERPYLDHPDELEYVTDAWAAQEFRKANVLRIAAMCESDPEWRRQMRAKGDELNEAAWQGLASFGDRHRNARCLAILMTEGLREISHRCEPNAPLPVPNSRYPESEWTQFVPQRIRVRQLLRNPKRLLKRLPTLANPGRWKRFIRALRENH